MALYGIHEEVIRYSLATLLSLSLQISDFATSAIFWKGNGEFMNYSIIFYIIGWILNLEAAFMLLPCITAVIYGEKSGFAFLITMAVCVAIGIPLT